MHQAPKAPHETRAYTVETYKEGADKYKATHGAEPEPIDLYKLLKGKEKAKEKAVGEYCNLVDSFLKKLYIF